MTDDQSMQVCVTWFAAGAFVGAALCSLVGANGIRGARTKRRRLGKPFTSDDAAPSSSSSSRPRGDYKLLLVVRRDLKMGNGKIAAQCCHATIGAVERCDASVIDYWRRQGEAKVVVKCDGEASMDAVRRSASRSGVPTYVVHDAGRTQIAAGSRTVLALGPAPVDEIDAVASHLKLL